MPSRQTLYRFCSRLGLITLSFFFSFFAQAGTLNINGYANHIGSYWDSGWVQYAPEPVPYGGIVGGPGTFSLNVSWGDPVQLYGDDALGSSYWEREWRDYWLPLTFSLSVSTPEAHYLITGEPDSLVDPNDWETNLYDVAGYVRVHQRSTWYMADEYGYHCEEMAAYKCPEGYTTLSMDPGIETATYGFASINYFDAQGNPLGGYGAGNSPQGVIQTSPVFLELNSGTPLTIDEAVTLLLTHSLQNFNVEFTGCIDDCSGPYISGYNFVATQVPLPASAMFFASSLGAVISLRYRKGISSMAQHRLSSV